MQEFTAISLLYYYQSSPQRTLNLNILKITKLNSSFLQFQQLSYQELNFFYPNIMLSNHEIITFYLYYYYPRHWFPLWNSHCFLTQVLYRLVWRHKYPCYSQKSMDYFGDSSWSPLLQITFVSSRNPQVLLIHQKYIILVTVEEIMVFYSQLQNIFFTIWHPSHFESTFLFIFQPKQNQLICYYSYLYFDCFRRYHVCI